MVCGLAKERDYNRQGISIRILPTSEQCLDCLQFVDTPDQFILQCIKKYKLCDPDKPTAVDPTSSTTPNPEKPTAVDNNPSNAPNTLNFEQPEEEDQDEEPEEDDDLKVNKKTNTNTNTSTPNLTKQDLMDFGTSSVCLHQFYTLSF